MWYLLWRDLTGDVDEILVEECFRQGLPVLGGNPIFQPRNDMRRNLLVQYLDGSFECRPRPRLAQ